MDFNMNSSETLYDKSPGGQEEVTKAGFLSRSIARTIDFIIIVALFEIISKVGYFAGLIYLLIADGLFQGRSVGKKLMGLKVVSFDETGAVTACSFKESIFRNFPFAVGYILCGVLGGIPLIGWILSFAIVTVILLFEGLVIIGNEKGMRLGDEIAKTRVIEDKQGGVHVS
jgi:uncharacterized RDD family membrane protein YckC